MIYKVKASELSGSVLIPGSKSHTIRALICALFAEGVSYIKNPLISSDTLSGKAMVEKFGAEIVEERDGDRLTWVVTGRGNDLKIPDDIVDVGNSGTSLYLGLAIAALINGASVFTGDHQIRNRSAQSLLTALNSLGVEAYSTRDNGCAPLLIKGPLKGGKASVEAVTSQYLTALLLAAPLGEGTVEIDVPLLNEKPYVEMTLSWLDLCGIKYNNDNFKKFVVEPGQKYNKFSQSVAADFSSSAFFFCAAAITGSKLFLEGLDYTDSQGDKKIVDILREMGMDIEIKENGIEISGSLKNGGKFDLNDTPDALPILAVTACFAPGETTFYNVEQARIKETDRISVMCEELKKMGADITEKQDGLVVRNSSLKGTIVEGHDDHRVIMALSVAGLRAEGVTQVNGADAVSVTFPNFAELLNSVNGNLVVEE